MSIQKVNGHIDAIDRKLGKSLKIAEKGNNMKLGDVVKLGRKTNSICSEINKSVKEYDVCLRPAVAQLLTHLTGRNVTIGSHPFCRRSCVYSEKDGEGRRLN